MNVLMISDVYFPRINGVSTSIQTFREGLSEEGVDVTLIAPTYAKTGGNDGADDADIVRLPARTIPFDPEDRLMRSDALRDLDQTLNGKHFDLIHIQTPFSAHYAGLKLARKRGIPCIATYHTHFEEYFHHYLPIMPRPLARSLTRRIARSQCNTLDALIVPSSAMHTALRDYGVTKPLHILPTGIPLAQFGASNDANARTDFRRKHGLPVDRPLALFVGRVAHEKNLRFLLDAMRHALSRNPDIALVIAGEGPALNSLKKATTQLGIDQDVFFLGYMDRKTELPACYAAADLFAFPSVTETQGLVLLEAMAAGLPVLGIPAMGAADILAPQRGAVCAPHDVQDFGTLMAKLLTDPAQLATLSADGREFAHSWGAPERARQLAELYRQLAA
ncbi:MAG TPA: glycosyltransferase [Rhodocyclaceae bacterium]|nr:glycosyltransferase [Rhodocyclaceae bacterium]